ncbi:hypothetical protein ABZ357_19125 [Streptomyces sp. NPDC005917]|uniref:hypothetical protein n=1 Tax=unclassified Streptomyces TaxID=2593676 RepID=UPI0033D04099
MVSSFSPGVEQVEQSTVGLPEVGMVFRFVRLLGLAAEHGGGPLPARLEEFDEGVAQR